MASADLLVYLPDAATQPLRVRLIDYSPKFWSDGAGNDTIIVDSYRFDFGDGTPNANFGRRSTVQEWMAQHDYPGPGTYTATLTATDETGRVETDQVTFTLPAAAGGVPNLENEFAPFDAVRTGTPAGFPGDTYAFDPSRNEFFNWPQPLEVSWDFDLDRGSVKDRRKGLPGEIVTHEYAVNPTGFDFTPRMALVNTATGFSTGAWRMKITPPDPARTYV